MTKEREKSDAAAQSLSLEHAKGMVSWARGDVHPIPGAHKGDAAAGGNESVLGWAEKRCICLEIPKPCAYLLIKKQWNFFLLSSLPSFFYQTEYNGQVGIDMSLSIGTTPPTTEKGVRYVNVYKLWAANGFLKNIVGNSIHIII
jgi:hypothetical protein